MTDSFRKVLVRDQVALVRNQVAHRLVLPKRYASRIVSCLIACFIELR